MKRRAILLAALMACTPVTVVAQTSDAPAAPSETVARTAAADRLMTIMRLDKQFDAVIPQIVDMMLTSMLPGNLGKEDEIRAILFEEMNIAFAARNADLIAVTRDVYARNFTAVQLEDMIVFYASPTGQAYIEKMPVVTQESMQAGGVVGRRAASEAMPKVMKRMQDAQLTIPKGS